MKRIMYIMLLLCAMPLTQAHAVLVTPGNIVMPTSPGELFSFDFIITDPMGVTGIGLKSTINVTGPGTLTLDVPSSEAVANDPGYWLFGNSGGAGAIDRGGDNYEFGDDPFDAIAQALATNDIVARYAFTWDGTEGDYTFTLLDTGKSCILLDDLVSKEPLQLPDPASGWYSYPIVDAGTDYFIVHIVPEPTTMILLALGGMAVLRKRMRKLS